MYDALALKTCVNGRKVYGGPARESVEKQIALIEEFVAVRSGVIGMAKDTTCILTEER